MTSILDRLAPPPPVMATGAPALTAVTLPSGLRVAGVLPDVPALTLLDALPTDLLEAVSTDMVAKEALSGPDAVAALQVDATRQRSVAALFLRSVWDVDRGAWAPVGPSAAAVVAEMDADDVAAICWVAQRRHAIHGRLWQPGD